MRVVRGFLVALSVIWFVLWGLGYLYISAMACAFAGPEGSKTCTIKPPWALYGEDLNIMVVFPAILATILIGLSYWAHLKVREAQNKDI